MLTEGSGPGPGAADSWAALPAGRGVCPGAGEPGRRPRLEEQGQQQCLVGGAAPKRTATLPAALPARCACICCPVTWVDLPPEKRHAGVLTPDLRLWHGQKQGLCRLPSDREAPGLSPCPMTSVLTEGRAGRRHTEKAAQRSRSRGMCSWARGPGARPGASQPCATGAGRQPPASRAERAHCRRSEPRAAWNFLKAAGPGTATPAPRPCSPRSREAHAGLLQHPREWGPPPPRGSVLWGFCPGRLGSGPSGSA